MVFKLGHAEFQTVKRNMEWIILALALLANNVRSSIFYHSSSGPGSWPENPCPENPCLNGGYCVTTNDALKCNCRHGFVGGRCQFEDPCTADPSIPRRFCSNKGTCQAVIPSVNDTIGSSSAQPTFECLCERGYLGPNCTGVDYCAANPCGCQGHGNSVCRNLQHGYACDCRKGYRGLWCNIDIDECTVEEPCANGATCINTIGSYRCVCQNGFKGPQCTEIHVACADDPCQNGGRCHPGSSLNFPDFCECASGYSGSHCQVNVDDCVNHACQNGGICQDQVNGYTCDCARLYGGKYCVDDIGYE